tara:strand:- start:4207 stop:4560 length:354 start_codon:yes stop_codon:yes gene_type:complete
MFQWIIRKTIAFMGKVYVILDSFLEHETEKILAIKIDDDFQNMTRKELCNHIEDKFQWPRDTFWNLESTQKIRVCSQMARNIMTVAEKQFYENKKKKKKKTVKNKSNIKIPFGGKVK